MRRRGRFGVVRGGQYARLRRDNSSAADFRLDQEMVDVFVSLHTPEGTVPGEAISDIRRLRQRPWRYLARRIREAREHDVPVEDVRKLVQVLDRFVSDLYSDAPRKAA